MTSLQSNIRYMRNYSMIRIEYIYRTEMRRSKFGSKCVSGAGSLCCLLFWKKCQVNFGITGHKICTVMFYLVEWSGEGGVLYFSIVVVVLYATLATQGTRRRLCVWLWSGLIALDIRFVTVLLLIRGTISNNSGQNWSIIMKITADCKYNYV